MFIDNDNLRRALATIEAHRTVALAIAPFPIDAPQTLAALLTPLCDYDGRDRVNQALADAAGAAFTEWPKQQQWAIVDATNAGPAANGALVTLTAPIATLGRFNSTSQ